MSNLRCASAFPCSALARSVATSGGSVLQRRQAQPSQSCAPLRVMPHRAHFSQCVVQSCSTSRVLPHAGHLQPNHACRPTRHFSPTALLRGPASVHDTGSKTSGTADLSAERERLPAGAHDITRAERVERLVRSSISGSSWTPRRRQSRRHHGSPGRRARRRHQTRPRFPCFVAVTAARPDCGPQGSPRPVQSRWPRPPHHSLLSFVISGSSGFSNSPNTC